VSVRNQWAALCAQNPNPAHGVAAEFPDGGSLVVEVAKITGEHLVWPPEVETPQPVWADITADVIDTDWSIGTADTAESRWPVGQLVLNTKSLEARLGHFRHPNPATRLAPGSLVRLGMFYLTDPPIWVRWFTGIIDRFDTDNVPGPETWRITAYDVLYYASGWKQMETMPPFPGELATAAMGHTFDAIRFPFETQVYVNPTWTVASFDLVEPALGLLNRIADSYGTRLFADAAGRAQNVPWGHTGLTPVAPLIEVISKAPGHVFGTWKWSSARQRTATWLRVADYANVETTRRVDLETWVLVGDREDVPGWPKLDLLFDQGSGVADALLTDALPRHGNELGIDYIDIDTAHRQNRYHSQYAFRMLRDYTVNDLLHVYPMVGRGTASIARVDCVIMGARKRVTRMNSYWRMTGRYYPKVLAVVPSTATSKPGPE